MKVWIRFEVTDTERRAIAHHYGDEGMAKRETVKGFLEANGEGGLESAVSDYWAAQEQKDE